MNNLTSIYRSHHCGELRAGDADKAVVLSGWISRKRNHGGVLFVDLRDHYGITQIVLHDEAAALVEDYRNESVIKVTGQVHRRGEELTNAKIATGEIEVHSQDVELLSAAKVLPFLVAEDDGAPETTRLKHRYLELRREKLHSNIMMRSKVLAKVRDLYRAAGFNEVQTPILTSSSPEGARDFIVPSRLHPGKFYALPQAPQQFKQLLMVSGFDRYFQIAPCFRDEDSRADRSPGEFYQIDLEMSFVEENDVLSVNEQIIHALFKEFSDQPISDQPFRRISHEESMRKYGSDKPDLRNPLEISEVSEVFGQTEFRVFKNILADGGQVYALAVDQAEVPSRKYFDQAIAEFTKASGQGLGYLIFEDNPEAEKNYRGSFAKLVSEQEAAALAEKVSSLPGIVFIAAGQPEVILPALGNLRTQLGHDFSKTDYKRFEACWVIDFPFYEKDLKTGKTDFGHNPFSMPKGGIEALDSEDLLSIKANQYDFVLNGYELASGAIRNHQPEIMFKAFENVGYTKEDVLTNFSGMVEAFGYGAPPHGGMALGLDRIIMLLCGEEAIRDVVAFPLAQNGQDLLMDAPSDISEQQLKDVHIKLDLPEEVLEAEKEK